MHDMKFRCAWVHFPVLLTFCNILLLNIFWPSCDSEESRESIESKAKNQHTDHRRNDVFSFCFALNILIF